MARSPEVEQLNVVVPRALKRQLSALLRLRGLTFVGWLRTCMETAIADMGSSSETTVKKADSEFLYPVEKERFTASRQPKLSVGKREQE